MKRKEDDLQKEINKLKASTNNNCTEAEIDQLKQRVDRTRKITEGDLAIVLKDMDVPFKPSEVRDMIWVSLKQEVDEDLDKCISEQEFFRMYKRCVSDKEWQEPRKLFNLVQFLMYDNNFKGWVGEEETFQLIYIREGRSVLDQQIDAIFGLDYIEQEMISKMKKEKLPVGIILKE